MADEILNARIESTHLGLEDHGIFTFMLMMKFSESSGQGFGGYALPPNAASMNIIAGIIKAVGVEKWEDLRGKYCRVKRDNGLLRAVGHIVEDRWMDMRNFAV